MEPAPEGAVDPVVAEGRRVHREGVRRSQAAADAAAVAFRAVVADAAVVDDERLGLGRVVGAELESAAAAALREVRVETARRDVRASRSQQQAAAG